MKTTQIRSRLSCLLLLSISILLSRNVEAQSATAAIPIGIGTDGCGSGTQGVRELSYNANTNVLANTAALCTPSLVNPAYSSYLSSVAFNPADHLFYYIQVKWTGSSWTSYVFRWSPYSCPGPGLAPFQTYTNQFIAGIAFDKNGIAWQMNFTGPAAPYGLELQRINFATGTIGAPQTITLPAGLNITQQNGDVEMTPSGQFYAVFDNKLITVNYQNYGVGTLNATYINTLQNTNGAQLVAMAYTDGKLLGHLSGAGCFYREIDPLSGATSTVTYAGAFSATDFTNIGSSIGIAKKLISATPTGTAGQYDLVYQIHVQNLGNVDDSTVMVTDDLEAVFGNGNVGNASLSWVGTPPAGMSLANNYNGRGNNNLLTNGVNVLPNYPVAASKFTIQLSVRVKNIVPGVVYNNSAVVTATGYRGATLRDVSTNGSKPDLNSNDRCDDTGEDQPTPFVINVAAEAPPCSALNSVLYLQDFGSGAGLATGMPGTSRTDYSGSNTAPLPLESYALASNANQGNMADWISLSDHTGGANGRMMLVNADVLGSRLFVDTVNISCAKFKYSFFSFVSFIGNNQYSSFCSAFGGFKFPKLTYVVRNASDNTIITNLTTGDITSSSWNQYGLKFVMPSGVTRVILEIYNAGEGGCGNDLGIDDVQFGLCDPQPTVTVSNPNDGCIGSTTTLQASLSDTTGMSGSFSYQWQSSTDNSTWSDISGATASTYTIAPLTPADAKYYRLVVTATGSVPGACGYTSNSFLLGLKAASTAPTAILRNRANACPGDAIILKATDGTPGTNAVYRWYTGGCGTTLVGTGPTLTVTPTTPTTYYVRLEGDCNVTACAQTTVFFSCDIDADKDGITDVAESGGVDPKLDSDYDGVPDYRDADYPGFVDSNGDGVNDNFDADKDGVPNFLDLDSDNDGIPDVVEAGGVDADGNGRIDNYTDTDGDGLSQNVDANNTGAQDSGPGLGTPDLDGDGLANAFDLDADGDGVPDLREVYGSDANNDGMVDGFTDTDGDGFADSVDGDVGNDGISERSAFALLRTGADSNGDGRADSYPNKNCDLDTRANPYDLDSDGDGITDVVEAQFLDGDANGKADGAVNSRGWTLVIAGQASLTLVNTDGTGRPNLYDIDADDDGIPDNIEGQATAAYLLPSGSDSDGDGIDNTYDNIVGFGGKGISVNNVDGDAFPDYIDTDTDGDGVIDCIEGNDFNLNRMPDDNVTLTGLDSDDDGLDDRFDNSSENSKGTSAYMGNGGTLNGDGAPGSRTMVQKSYPNLFDRDWRVVNYVLNVDFITFRGTFQNGIAQLDWALVADEQLSALYVERSVDGQQFTQVASLAPHGVLHQSDAYAHADRFAGAKAWYRIRVVTAAGATKYSKVIQLQSGSKTYAQVAPNPVRGELKMTVMSDSKSNASFTVYDLQGKQLMQSTVTLEDGVNTLAFPATRTWARGTYVVRVVQGTHTYVMQFLLER